MIKNAVDAGAFKFDVSVRARVRGQLGLGDEFVVGHAGRFTSQKNHAILVEVFAEALRAEPNSKLLLAGDGYLRPDIERSV